MVINENKIGNIIYGDNLYDSKEIMKQIRIVKNLIVKSGVESNQTIGIALPRTPWVISSMAALFELGIPFLPIDMNQLTEQTHYMLDNADVRYIITMKEYSHILYNRKMLYIDIDIDIDIDVDVDVDDKLELDVNMCIGEIAYILYTSGSTGRPKAVEITRKGLMNFMEAIPEIIDFSKGKIISCFTGFTFDIFFLESLLSLYKGLTIVLANEEEQKNPKLIAELIAKNNIQMIQMTPSRMRMLSEYDKSLKCLSNVKEIMLGGESFPQNLLYQLQTSTHAKIYNMYGPTETTIWSTVSELTNKELVYIGRPIKNTSIYILDSNQREVAKGEIGEICIAGAGLAKGYRNNLELTQQSFTFLPSDPKSRIYKTGDLGKYIDDVNIMYLGRVDNQIKLRGHRIELEYIESYLNFMEEIKAAIVCLWGKENDKNLVVFYIADNVIDPKTINEFLNSKIPQYMVPKKYVKIDSFEFTLNGKIDRDATLFNNKEYLEENHNIHAEQLTKFEAEIVEIISSNSFNNRVSLEDSLLNITDSIKYVTMIVDLEEKFDIEFKDEALVVDYFSNIKEMCKYIDEKLNERISSEK